MSVSRVGVSARRAAAEGRLPRGRAKKVITWQGQTHSQAEWSRRTGVPELTIRGRLLRGLSLELVFSKERLRPTQYERRGFVAKDLPLQVLTERLDAHLVEYPSGCWGWGGYYNSDETACIPVTIARAKRKMFTARQVSWLVHIGDIPAGRRLKSTCKHKWCINPDHLRLSYSAEELAERRRASARRALARRAAQATGSGVAA